MRWEGHNIAVEVLFSKAGLATQILVETGEQKFLLDAGDGVLRDLFASGVTPHALSGVFLTHGHGDHIAGLYGILCFLRSERHERPFTVWYPKGCCEVKAILSAFQTCYGTTIPYELTGVSLRDGEQAQLGEVKVLARKVKHWNSIQGEVLTPTPALGYRISFRGETVAFTGDSAASSVLEELIKNVDLALIDATLDDSTATKEQSTYLHLTIDNARRIARFARRAVLLHRSTGRSFFT